MRSRASNGCDARFSLTPEDLGSSPGAGVPPAVVGDSTHRCVVDSLRGAGCVFAEEEAAILIESAGSGADSDSALDERVARRVAGEPLEQIVGWVDFAGLRLRTLPGVFVPRQRTRRLVDHTVRALEQMTRLRGAEPLSDDPAAPIVVEAFCGVGPVGSSVAASVPGVRLHLGDADSQAVECAVGNAQRAAIDRLQTAVCAERGHSPGKTGSAGVVRGHRLDCLDGLPVELRHGVDVITAVPPYVPTPAADFLPREAVDFEPATALFGGADGLDLVRRLITESGDWLSPDGILLLELGREQAEHALAHAAAQGMVGRSHLGEGDDHADDHDPGSRGVDDAAEDEHTVVVELRRARHA